MSRPSQKAQMREALLLTEGNLSSLIGSRYDNGQTADSSVMVKVMETWRAEVRRALGHYPAEQVRA